MSDIFSADELAADATGADGEIQQPEPKQDERPRDEHGRFAPVDKPADEIPPEQQAIPPEANPEAKDRTVPQGALHAEREKRKAAEERARLAQEQLDAIANMRRQIAEQQPPKQGEAPPADDPAAVGHLRQRLEQIEQQQQGLVKNHQLQQVEQMEVQQLSSVLNASEVEFRAQKPDYDAAIDHVVRARAQELKLYGLSDMDVQQTLQQEVLDITRSAIRLGRAPAEVAYELATLRGYRPDSGQQDQQGQQQPPKSAAEQQIEAIAAARAGSKSLGQAAGSGPAKDLNANSIAAMSDDEFAVLYSTPEGRRMIDAL